MTVSAMDIPPTARVTRRSGFTITADGSYAACLAEVAAPGEDGDADGGWFAERWTLSGPEPYAVPLPAERPEDPAAQVVPLPDGRVLISRRAGEAHELALLYPTGPDTGELPLGTLTGTAVKLLPPSPQPGTAFALVYEAGSTAVVQVHGVPDGVPRPVVTVPGRCTGGVWLDRTGALLALDRELDGRTKAVAVDLRTGETSPLLQITEDSDDRLLLAEPDSGLLLLRSDATGEARLGWGVLGSRRPVRFPDALRVDGALLTPVAAQPGQILMPEASVVALRAEVPGGAESLALWRPGERRLYWRASPHGWLGATGLWLPGGELRLPYAAPEWPCGLAAYDPPPVLPEQGDEDQARWATPRRVGAAARPAARRRWSVLPLQQAPLAAAKAG